MWLAIFFNILTNIGFKFSAMQVDTGRKWGIFSISIFFGLLNSIFMTEALKTIPLNIGCVLFFSITIIGLCFSSYFIFNEAMSWKQISGTFIVIGGVFLINS
jgi:multidrug transporter EmrE-like cation transporter